MIIIPPYLSTGDVIGMVCPSGFMAADKVRDCIQTLQQWGFEVKAGRTVGSQFHYFSGTDDARINDLQMMLDDERIRAVFCARGGYGLSRIIDKIDFTAFQKNPKWIIGFSDVTILHAHLYSNFNTASLHAPMAAAFSDGGSKNEYVRSLLHALQNVPSAYQCEANSLNIQGIATGELVGGNLCLLAHLIGSRSSIDTRGRILFIEDVGEYIYSIDRLMQQLKRAGLLSNLAGLIVGSFSDMKDTTIPFGATAYDAIYEAVKACHYPVCFNFPVGHTNKNLALKHGVSYRLAVSADHVLLTEKH